MTSSPAPPPGAVSLELTYEKRCPGMAQPRSVDLAATTLTLADEAGEARLVQLTPERIAALAAALKKAGLERLSSAPGASKEPCTITLHAVIDGVVKDVNESPAVAVNDAAAWKAVQKVIEDLAYGG